MSTPTSTWQDRRGMFQKGKEVHEPSSQTTGRRPSQGGVADALRRASVSSTDGMEKTPTNSSVGSPPSPNSQRRRSSAASSGLFSNLNNMKRGSQDYGERRASHSEMVPGGIMSGWFNQTFKGMQQKQQPTAMGGGTQNQADQTKRGVME